MDSVPSMMSTLQSTLDEPTMNDVWTPDSTWTPGSSPRSDAEKKRVIVRDMEIDERNESIEMERVRTFDEKEVDVDEWEVGSAIEARMIPGRNSVGVAF